MTEELLIISNDTYEHMLDSMQEVDEYMNLSEQDREKVDEHIFNILFPSE